MNLQQFAVISNKYDVAILKVIGTPAVNIKGEFTKGEFEASIVDVVKHQYLDVVIMDATVLKNPSDILEAVRYLKLHLNSNVRIILLCPNLNDKGVIQQLLVYGVYDLVKPEIDENTMDDIQIENKLIADLSYVISEPVRFDMVVNDLSIESISQEIINIYKEDLTAAPTKEEEKPKQKEKKEKKIINKVRTLCVYDKQKGDTPFEIIKKNGRYNIIDCIAFDEEKISDTDFTDIDIVAFANVDPSGVSYVSRLVEVNENKAMIIAGYDDFDQKELASKLDGVKTFLFDGTPLNYGRLLSVALSAKEEATTTRYTRTFAVYGVKGGVGSTTLTAILAKDYAKKHPNERVVVVDFNSHAGDIAEKLGNETLIPNLFQYIDAMAKAKKQYLDLGQLRDKVNQYVKYSKENGVFVLPTAYTDIYSFTEYRYDTRILAELYSYMIECLKQSYDAIFLDVCKYGGFTYDVALAYADKFILVGDNKLSSTSHMLQKIQEVKHDQSIKDRTYIIINKSNAKTNEKEYENLRIMQEKMGKDKLVTLPFDKDLFNDAYEMEVKYGKKMKKELNKVWSMVYPAPKK